jgi:hypothetical protein
VPGVRVQRRQRQRGCADGREHAVGCAQPKCTMQRVRKRASAGVSRVPSWRAAHRAHLACRRRRRARQQARAALAQAVAPCRRPPTQLLLAAGASRPVLPPTAQPASSLAGVSAASHATRAGRAIWAAVSEAVGRAPPA